MASSLDLSLGAIEVGTWLSVFLYGIITLQVYIYTQASFKDHWAIQTLVGSMWILDTTHTVLLFVWIYYITVANFGQPAVISQAHWSRDIVLLFNGLMAAAVQSFFAYRIRIISGRWFISILSWIVSFTRVVFIITIVVLSLKTPSLTEYVEKYDWTVPASLSILSFGDLLNTAALCYYLSAKRTEFSHVNLVINKLIVWAVETGLLTSICGILMLAFFVSMPTNLLWLALFLFFPKFYTISLLTSLNNRPYLRGLGSSAGNSSLASAVQFSNRRGPMHVEMVPVNSGDDSSERVAMQKP